MSESLETKLAALRPGVVVAATFDVKSLEAGFAVAELERRGVNVITIDCGILGTSEVRTTISREEVAAAGGASLEELRRQRRRDVAIPAMHRGLAVCIEKLAQLDKVEGYLGLGGGTNAAFAGTAFALLPYGMPKVLITTNASGDVGRIVGIKDVTLIHSVVDVLGLNDFLCSVLRSGCAAMAAMVAEASAARSASSRHKDCVAMTTFGCTTEGATHAFDLLSERGFQVLSFHARGTGGRAAESFMRAGRVGCVFDLTTTEIADELVGGIRSAGPDRLTAAGEKGLPQVVLPGAIDVVNLGPKDGIPAKFANRNIVMHNPNSALMRTTPEENSAIASFVAERLNQAKGPAAVVIPLKGFSAYDRKDGPFFDPAATAAFRETLTAKLNSRVRIETVDAHINDRRCMELATNLLASLIN